MTTTALRNFIDGDFVEPAEDRTAPVVNPATEDAYVEAPVSSAADVDRAMQAAATAFETWRETTPSERQLMLLRLADAIEADADNLADLESANTGKPRHLALGDEIPPMVDQIRFFAGAARVLEGLSAGEYMAGHTSMIRREPIGVCAQVTPWNYPMMMAVWKIAPALAAGNTVVLKPSDTTPVSTLRLAELAAGIFPRGGAQRHHRRPRHREGDDRAPHPADGLDHRFGSGGDAGGDFGGCRPEAHPSRARGQGAGDRVRRRRCRRRG